MPGTLSALSHISHTTFLWGEEPLLSPLTDKEMGPEGSFIIMFKVTHPGSVKMEVDVTHCTAPKIFFTKSSLLQGLLRPQAGKAT